MPTEIVGYVVRQTTIREEFIVRIYLKEDRSVDYACCSCIAGIKANCKHGAAGNFNF